MYLHTVLQRLQEIFNFSTGFCLFVCLFVEVDFVSSSFALCLRFNIKCQDITTEENNVLESTNSILLKTCAALS